MAEACGKIAFMQWLVAHKLLGPGVNWKCDYTGDGLMFRRYNDESRVALVVQPKRAELELT